MERRHAEARVADLEVGDREAQRLRAVRLMTSS
jgi:hypothetical protein